ncbi:restriction endonuclease [Paenibacillus sp. N4]|uniref:restriction endonuclease n=1 Tax=Paenibacillus vietnamensis TaxID=2590547 RepID=UPI001CD0E979|nr:restriction endonuclease [Paenibacillus vietnamensis]MCA0757007.1 restriction endonuclease [Paenibacillus vietnamensis]
MMKWWMVRAGDNNELIPQWQSKQVASIGWAAIGNPRSYQTKEKLVEKAHIVYSDNKPGTRLSWASQVWRFYSEIEVNDKIITYSKETREYLLGTVTRAPEYRPDLIDSYYPNVISVAWDHKRISRDLLSQGAKNSLGGILTVFRVDDWGQELLGLLAGAPVQPEIDQVDGANEYDTESFIEQARTMIEDLVDKLDPWQMQELIAGLLQAMGYQVTVSPKGPDGGVDVLAHRDAFGFENPIIKVQVKHRHAASGGPEVQQLIGANPHGASCLFVSTGGFTAAARSSAQQNGVKLLDLAGIVQLINEWYDKMPVDKQALIPLKRIYVPS